MIYLNKSPQFLNSNRRPGSKTASPMKVADKQADIKGRIQHLAFSATRSIKEQDI
jgi:hypothetical protein